MVTASLGCGVRTVRVSAYICPGIIIQSKLASVSYCRKQSVRPHAALNVLISWSCNGTGRNYWFELLSACMSKPEPDIDAILEVEAKAYFSVLKNV
jgi:hypothetical protein